MIFFAPPAFVDATEDEWEEFAKAAGGVHKYTKRVQVGTDSRTGRARYRYFYSDASLAHRAAVGDRLNLRDRGGLVDVVAVGKDIQIRRADGTTERVQLHELHERVYDAWREKHVRGAQRVTQRWAAEHGRTSVIADSDNPAGARRVHGKVAKSMAAAKIDDWQARSLVVFLCKRQGWSEAAQGAMVDLLAKDAGAVAANSRQIIRAAENLAAVDKSGAVTPAHVVEAAASRLPPAGFPDAWGDLKATLDQENAATEAAVGTLEAIIASGSRVPEAVAAFVRGSARFEAGFEAQRLAQAFPGLRNDESLQRHQQLEGRFRAAVERIEAGDTSGHGVAATVYIADRDGFPVPRAARYRVMEAEDVIASHVADARFKKNPRYPDGVQERVYHLDEAEQNKVRGNATRFRPDLVNNTNPDAVNGPPVVTTDGVVLGGNSRAMTMQLLYGEGRGEALKGHLVANAYQFGIDKATVAGMRAPVLVRELDDVTAATASREELKDLVRATNEAFTQSMDPRTMQVALAQKITPAVIDQLAAMPTDRTLAEHLSGTTTGREFVASLAAAGVIDRRNRSQYVRDDGLLNNDGKAFVERLLVGKMVPDAELMGEVSNSTMSSLARIAPYVMSAAAANPAHDLTADLRVALRAQVDVAYSGNKSLDDYLRQPSLAVGAESILGEPPIARNPRARVLYDALQMGPLVLARAMRQYAQSAQFDRAGQGGLFGDQPSPLDQLRGALMKKALSASFPGVRLV